MDAFICRNCTGVEMTGRPRSRELPLVGRDVHRARLWSSFAAATGGGLRVALVTGEPGIGKSRLLRELRERVEGEGGLILQGGATEAAGMPPFLPVLEALGQRITAKQPEELLAELGPRVGILRAIFPELPRAAAEQPLQLPPEQSRMRLFDAVAGWLAAIARQQPLGLVLDDLHWADPATFDLLIHLARRASDLPLLIAGAYRAHETDRNLALGRALVELNRLRVLQIVALEPLDLPELERLASHLAGAQLDPGLVAELGRQSEGNPFYAEELLRGWVESGAVTREGERARQIGPLPSAPDTLFDAIQRRLEQLPAATIEVLRTASIAGRTVDLGLLSGIAAQTPEHLETALQPASRAGIVRGDPLTGAVTFGHDKIRDCLYGQVTPLRRRRLHEFIGLQLEALHGESGAERLASLAFHFARAGDSVRGVEYGLAAARQAIGTGAGGGARQVLASVLGLLPDDHARRGEYLFLSGEAAQLDGADDVAAEQYQLAAVWFSGHDDRSRAARARLHQGRALWRLERIEQARVAFTAGIDEVAEGLPEWIELQAELGSLLCLSLGRFDEAEAAGRAALAAARTTGDPGLIALTARTLGNTLIRGCEFDEGLSLVDSALTVALSSGDHREASECYASLVVGNMWGGDLRAAYAAARAQLIQAERSQDLYQLRHVYCWLAPFAIGFGEAGQSQRYLDAAEQIVRRLASPEPLAFLHQTRALIAIWRDEGALAVAEASATIRLIRETNPAALVWYQPLLAIAYSIAGDRTSAEEAVRAAETLLPAPGVRSVVVPEIASGLASFAIAFADDAMARRVRQMLRPYADRLANVSINRLLGELALVTGELDEASRWLSRAERAHRRDGMVLELAATLRALALLELKRGGSESNGRALVLLEEAATLTDRADAPRLSERARGLAATIQTTAAPLPAGLSEREADVLRLLARGSTNREIAAALFISEKTVANHLTSIYTKTGVDNRVGAAAFALRAGLG